MSNQFNYPSITMAKCIEMNDFPTLQHIVFKGCPVDQSALAIAAKFGHLDLLKWLHSTLNLKLEGRMEDNVTEIMDGIGDNEFNTIAFAAYSGSLECLEYAFEHGCKFHPETTCYIVNCLANALCDEDKYNKIFECLEYVVKKGCPIDPSTINTAVSNNDVKLLRFIYENGCTEIEEEAIMNAAEGGHVEAFTFCFEICPNKDKFWSILYDEIIDKLDFTKAVWRPLFVIPNLNKFDKLSQALKKVKVN
jgi:hypothetical protein